MQNLWIDLAEGGAVLQASDEYLNPAERLIDPAEPVAGPGPTGSRGAWLDGWETRRVRPAGHEWAILRLGRRGTLHQLVVDTSHVTTSLPAACSVEAIDLPGEPGIVELMRHRSLWREVVCRTSLRGSGRHDFPADREPATHVRLVIYPDGGVARLRALGDPLPPDGLAERGEVDLAALDNGGRVIATSDPQASSPNSMLRPGDARDHRDGWMTRRRREPGNEWAVIRLAARGTVDRIVVDTRPFPGDSPEEISVAAADLPGAAPGELRDAEWTVLLPRTDAEPGARSRFEHLEAPGPISHLRLELHPDGAVGRFRAFGRAEGTEDGGRPDPR